MKDLIEKLKLSKRFCVNFEERINITLEKEEVDIILTALKQKEWIRVEDIEDFPQEPILAYNRFGLYLTGYLEPHDVGYICVNGFKEIHNVTHIKFLTLPTES